jgi:hypothetical protein
MSKLERIKWLEPSKSQIINDKDERGSFYKFEFSDKKYYYRNIINRKLMCNNAIYERDSYYWLIEIKNQSNLLRIL